MERTAAATPARDYVAISFLTLTPVIGVAGTGHHRYFSHQSFERLKGERAALRLLSQVSEPA
jgi:fatty-acid desaturase